MIARFCWVLFCWWLLTGLALIMLVMACNPLPHLIPLALKLTGIWVVSGLVIIVGLIGSAWLESREP